MILHVICSPVCVCFFSNLDEDYLVFRPWAVWTAVASIPISVPISLDISWWR